MGCDPCSSPAARASRHDYRLGPSLAALVAAHLNRVFGAIALNALEVDAISAPWLHQDTTTLTLEGTYEEEARQECQSQQAPERPLPPRPAYGHSKDGHDDLQQVRLSLGGSSEGLPRRGGRRDGTTSDSPETPGAIEACLAFGLDGVRGLGADRQASCKRTLGLCLETRVGLITLVPRTCAVRQALEAWGPPQGALPLLLEKPGRTRQEPPRRWHGRSVTRPVTVEDADGRLAGETLRVLVVRSRQWAPQAAIAYTAAQAQEAERIAEPIRRVEARGFACAADAAAALTDDEGQGQGRRGRTPPPWRSHALRDRVDAVNVPSKRTRRGRPPKTAEPAVEVRYGLSVAAEALRPSEDAHGWTVLATTLRPEEWTEAERLPAYQAQQITGEPGVRWLKNPATIRPVWWEKPERLAAWAMLTVVGFLVDAMIQRPVQLSLHDHNRHLPGNTGPTAMPTAAVVFALLTPVTLVHFAVDHAPLRQVHGIQDAHRIVCEAVGIDQAWYQGAAAGHNSPLSTTPP